METFNLTSIGDNKTDVQVPITGLEVIFHLLFSILLMFYFLCFMFYVLLFIFFN